MLYYSVIIFSISSLAGCYYHPDLCGQTLGSGAGAVVGGVTAAAVTSDLIVLGSGIIVGSIIGGSIGSEFDLISPLRMEDPVRDPAPLYYYKVLRAPLTVRATPVEECFYPGLIVTEQTTLAEIAKLHPPCRL